MSVEEVVEGGVDKKVEVGEKVEAKEAVDWIIDSIDYVTGIGNVHALLVHSLSSLPDKHKQYNICKLWLAVLLFF